MEVCALQLLLCVFIKLETRQMRTALENLTVLHMSLTTAHT